MPLQIHVLFIDYQTIIIILYQNDTVDSVVIFLYYFKMVNSCPPYKIDEFLSIFNQKYGKNSEYLRNFLRKK